jgi:glycosyltransferase involved in cell wall biosynthesis
MQISVCIASYGEERWRRLACERALPSAHAAGAQDIVLRHEPEGDVASSRNAAAAEAKGDLLVFLDADDELDPGFLRAMQEAASSSDPERTLYTPKVSYIIRGRAQPAKFWASKPLREGNWMVIGTMVPKRLFFEVGGFESWPLAYEDWQLFCKLEKAGASIVRVPKAVYRAHWSTNSRNKRISREEAVRIHYQIGRELYPDYYDESWLTLHLRNAR